jgi:hypothetical protein
MKPDQSDSRKWAKKIKFHIKKLADIKTRFFCFDPIDIYANLDQQDLALASLWVQSSKGLESKINHSSSIPTGHIPNQNQFELSSDHEVTTSINQSRNWSQNHLSKIEGATAKMLSARGAEKAALLFYEGMGVPVKDISIHQITKDSDEWKSFDLLLGREDLGITVSIDVKNARGSKSNRNNFSEFCVPRFKRDRENSEINILGILSPYLKYELIKDPNPNTIQFHLEDIRVLGETSFSVLKDLEEKFQSSKLTLCLLRRDEFGNYLPRWVFDGPDHLYLRLERKLLSDFENILDYVFNLDKEHIKRQGINPIAFSLTLKQMPPESWMSEMSQREIYLLKNIYTSKIDSCFSLPYLFMSILSDFLEGISQEEEGFNPSFYNGIIYIDARERTFPLGLMDPLDSIADLIDTLVILWKNRREVKLDSFKFFKLDGRGLLQGKIAPNDSWITILSYCGGWQNFVKCGYRPLVVGRDKTCGVCGKLICPKCGHCNDLCARYKRQISGSLIN